MWRSGLCGVSSLVFEWRLSWAEGDLLLRCSLVMRARESVVVDDDDDDCRANHHDFLCRVFVIVVMMMMMMIIIIIIQLVEC